MPRLDLLLLRAKFFDILFEDLDSLGGRFGHIQPRVHRAVLPLENLFRADNSASEPFGSSTIASLGSLIALLRNLIGA